MAGNTRSSTSSFKTPGIKTIKDFEEYTQITTTSNKLFVVDLHAHWCGPCAQLIPTWKSLQMNIDGFQERAMLLQVDITNISGFENYKQTSKPYFLLVKDKVVLKELEFLNAPELLRSIDEHIPAIEVEE
eukprot:GEMP01052333.1.p1 GENE.GEMP01052333.1~~GEMP01052333.1.p1  ORF type:complete len:130 (+),score=28.66 GEMP01052333.1:84-473(+)